MVTVMGELAKPTVKDRDRLRARVAELEDERDSLERQLRQSEYYRGNALDRMRQLGAAIAAKDAALKPLADLVPFNGGAQKDAPNGLWTITNAHVKAARAARVLTAPAAGHSPPAAADPADPQRPAG